jgi:hypothetical protein
VFSIDALQARLCKLLDSTSILRVHRSNRHCLRANNFKQVAPVKSLHRGLHRVIDLTRYKSDFASYSTVRPYFFFHFDSAFLPVSPTSGSRISCRVSRSGKITFNTCFAVYKIHFRRARSSIYIPSYIYRRTHPVPFQLQS